MAEKNQILTLTIQGYTAEGLGVGRTEDGMAVFVPGAARGDRLEVLLVKVKKTYAFGKLLRVLEPSPNRIEPDCPVFAKCGGCDFRHLAYEEELRLKAERVRDAMRRIGGFDVSLPGIVPSPAVEGYRNKAVFPLGEADRRIVFGLYRSRSHALVPVTSCAIQTKEACALAAAVCRWAEECGASVYDENTQTGLLRHVAVRQGVGGCQLTVIATADVLPREDRLAELARDAVPALAGVILNVNKVPGNRILGDSCRTIWGEDRLPDTLAGHRFSLSPLSFYQVNHGQTEQLYAYVSSLAAPTGGAAALDLYCGVGTITLTLASRCREVVGVEIVPAAVEDARQNAARNGVGNVRFLCADAGKAAEKLAEEGFRPEVIVVDPPRKGLDEAAVRAICRMAPMRVVYVSCDCASMARDARLLHDLSGYAPAALKAFDMFPRTANVETVCCLHRQKKDFISVPYEPRNADYLKKNKSE
ncbi:MAG: 23S rRNA (uracil(1939)-C(5))-methyltransferase RlmD [Clostridia bacterium]|nr:23S rRNA (uracil(1939)-C(5))-methyltransferase RlmD [Clostridia bacterium]